MKSKLNPYLSFDGTARTAMEFYQTVFDGKLDATTFKQGGMPGDPVDDDKVMHATLEADNGITFFAADMPKGMERNPVNTMSMSLSGDNETELRVYWNKLSDEAAVMIPLEKASWGDRFGMLTDKFGVSWMINISAPKE